MLPEREIRDMTLCIATLIIVTLIPVSATAATAATSVPKKTISMQKPKATEQADQVSERIGIVTKKIKAILKELDRRPPKYIKRT